MDDKYILIYHKEDNDGVFSAAIALYYLIHSLHVNYDDISKYPVDYNDMNKMSEDPEFFEKLKQAKAVILLDISFNNGEYMKKIYTEIPDKFVWIDHHGPIIKESEKLSFDKALGIRDVHYSTIYNAFEYFFNPLKIGDYKLPELLNKLQLWDSWTYQEKDKDYIYKLNLGVTHEFLLNLELIYKTIELIFDKTLDPSDDKVYLNEYLRSIELNCYSVGKIIADHEQEKMSLIIKNYGDFNWTVNGRPAVMLMLQGPTNSLMFDSVKDKVSNGIVFKYNNDDTWGVSLYNTKNDNTFHCGDYLKQTFKKGGGHQGAGGACISKTKFISILNKKSL